MLAQLDGLVGSLATIGLFYRVGRRAGLLLVPYLPWVAFATYRNYGFWVLNERFQPSGRSQLRPHASQ